MPTLLYRVGMAVVTVADPDAGFDVSWQKIGGSQRTLGGTLRRHYITLKGRWTVTWSHMTSIARDLLVTELKWSIPMTWSPPDEAATYTVLVLDTFTIQPTEFGWTVTATIEEI